MTDRYIVIKQGLRYAAAISVITIGLLSILATGSSENGGGGPTTSFSSPAFSLALTQFATGLNSPVGVYNAGPGDDRLFVIEQTGVIRIVLSDGTVLVTPFLDISARVDSSAGEEGLLGLAFHPNYATNGFFYVNYTNTTGIRRTHISRFQVTGNANVADSDDEIIILTVDQPFSNHNAGDIHFGPDGLLYIPLGDGGSGGDPNNNAQNMGLLLGKVVRIDVDSGPGSPPDCVGLGAGQYTIPSTNPFVDGAGGVCDEIWAVGLRNPWRSSFDQLTGDFYIGDVGQGAWEEIDFEPAGSPGGANYGWRCFEGNASFHATGCAPSSSFSFPIVAYSHSGGDCSVIGGYVYRGTLFPALFGRYVFTDFCTGNFWDSIPDGAGGWQTAQHTNLLAFGYVSFGEDANGEVYVVHQGSGALFRLEGM